MSIFWATFLFVNSVLYLWFKIGFLTLFLGSIAILIFLNRRFLKLAIQTLPRDIKGLKMYATVEREIKKHTIKNSTIGTVFRETVRKQPYKIAFINAETGQKWTFLEIERLTNSVGNYFSKQGLKSGDSVALLMGNCPEYVAIWLGLSKIGVVTALINNNLRADSLGHSINISKAKAVIIGSEYQQAYEEDLNKGSLAKDINVHVFGDQPLSSSLKAQHLNEALNGVSTDEPIRPQDIGFKSVLMYIYTSGTTGLPKAAIITHARFFMASCLPTMCVGAKTEDNMYITMPLYHTAAGVMGIGGTMIAGCTTVIRKKFSASRFWEDCIQFNCTVTQYIGEICRYLLAQPHKSSDRAHKVRLMFGNGLRPNIWKEFVDRFGISHVTEFYGSTEGNANLSNIDNTVGACGFMTIYPFMSKIIPIALIKINEETGEVIRDKNGLCIKCKPGETGEMVAKIIKNNPIKDFTGYLSEKDTKKKLIRDIFSKGDVGFSSGDILYMDEKGYIYFKDRTGDTFRWKGENVSTTEVESVIHKIVGLRDATVYGVEIPNADGRAGMAAIADTDKGTDMQLLNKKLKEMLPAYARPTFIRLCENVETTGTYKLKKAQIQKENFDPSKCGTDKLFYINNATNGYIALGEKEYRDICDGVIKF